MYTGKEILFEVTEDAFLVANGGRPFSRKGVISICASHLSEKQSGNIDDNYVEDDHKLIEYIRQRELQTYENDPNRITSDFRSEDETSHDYGGRLIWELLQNADDAMRKVASGFIGQKGLGFKAVLEVTDEPEIHSGPFHFLFSAQKTQQILKKKGLHDGPPLLKFRIPHECKVGDQRVCDLLKEGYATVIRLPWKDKSAKDTVVDKLGQLDAALFLLLVQELSYVRIHAVQGEITHKIMRQEKNGLSSGEVNLSTHGPNGTESRSWWRRWTRDFPVPDNSGKKLTVAICLPLSEQGDPVAYDDDIPFHVFFPTDEKTSTRALIHASFELEQNRKHIRKGGHDKRIREEFCSLFSEVLTEISPRTALEAFGPALETFGRVDPDDGNLGSLKEAIKQTLCETPFVPVIGGSKVTPDKVRLWKDGLGDILQENAKQVWEASLLIPGLGNLHDILEKLKAQDLTDECYVKLLRYCRNDSLEACLQSLRVVIEGGLKRLPDKNQHKLSEKYQDLLESIRKIPCWWTEDNTARALDGTPSLLLNKRPKNWPDWLPADSLHPEMQEEVKKQGKKCKEELKELEEPWENLTEGWLIKRNTEFLYEALLPFIREWDEKCWDEQGWRVLYQVLLWSPTRKFEEVSPWIESPADNSQRKELVKVLRLPTVKGWLSAANCYAGQDWDGPPSFDWFFADKQNRSTIRPFEQWPDSAKEKTTKGQWKALLRWVGVSWEPKIRYARLEKYNLVDGYRKTLYIPDSAKWIHDWKIEYFPACTQDGSNSSNANVIKMVLPLYKELTKHKAKVFLSKGRQGALRNKGALHNRILCQFCGLSASAREMVTLQTNAIP